MKEQKQEIDDSKKYKRISKALSQFDAFGYDIGLNLNQNKKRVGTRIGSLATLIYITLSLAFVIHKILEFATFGSNQLIILNERTVKIEDSQDDQTFEDINIFPYFQIYDRFWNAVDFDEDIQRFMHFEILINEYKDNEHLINDFQEVKVCTLEDFKGVESIFQLKSKKKPKSLVCLNDLKKVIVKNGMSNRKS